MEIPLSLVCDAVAKKKKPWPHLTWIGKGTSKLYHVHRHRVGEVILPGGQVSKIAKLEDITKQAVAINYTYRGSYIFGLLVCGDVFMWNNDTKILRLIEGLPELASHLSSLHSEKESVLGSVLNHLSNWSIRSTGKTRASGAVEQSTEVSCHIPYHQRPKIWGTDDLSKIIVVLGGKQIYLWECDSNAEYTVEGKVQGSWSVVKDSDGHPLPDQDNKESVISANFVKDQTYGNSYHISFVFISKSHLVCTTCVLVWSGIQDKIIQNALGEKVLSVEVMQPQQVMTYWHCKKESLHVLWNKPDVISHHRGALVVSHAHNCGILCIATNSHRPLSSKLVQLRSTSDAIVAVDVQGSPKRSDPRFHWIQDLAWTRDNVYVVGCMRSGALFLALRLGPLVQISCTGQGIQLPLSTLLPVHPLQLQTSEFNKEVRDVEDLSTSTDSYPCKHIIYRVSTHSQEDLILFTSGLRIFVFRLPDNAAKDSDVADQLLGCAWHSLHQLRKSPLSHQYAYIRSSTWRLTRVSTLDISQSNPHLNSWNDVSVWENVAQGSHETSLNTSQYAGQSLFQNVLDPLLASIVLTASHDGPETQDWKKRRKKISFCTLVVLKTLLNQDDNGTREDCMKKLQQVLRIFHEIQQIFELGHGHSYFLCPSIQLLHRLIHAVLKKRKQSGKQEVIDSLLVLANFLGSAEKTLTGLYEMKTLFQIPGKFVYTDVEVCQGFCVSNATGLIDGVPQHIKGINVAVRMKKIWICLYKNIESFYLRTKLNKGMDSKSCQKLRTVIALVQERLQRFGYEFKNTKVKMNPGVEIYLKGKNLNAIEKWKSEIIELIYDPFRVKEIKSRMHSILYTLIYLRRYCGVIDFIAWLCTLLICVISSTKSFSYLVPQKSSTSDPKNLTKARSLHSTKELLRLNESVNSTPENMWKARNSAFKAVSLVIRSLGRIIAKCALDYDINIPSVHSPHVILPLWDAEQSENVLPQNWMKPSFTEDKSLQDIELSSEDLCSPECGARLLLLAGDWSNLSYLARQVGDTRLALLSAVLATRAKTRERVPETLDLSSLFTSVITSTLISDQRKTSDFEGIQELLQLSAMVGVHVIARLLSLALAKVKREVVGLPLLVPWEIYIPAPPLFCPQPSNGGDVHTEGLEEEHVRAVISDWIRLAITVLSSASLGKFLLLEYCNETPKVNDKVKRTLMELENLATSLGPYQKLEVSPGSEEWQEIRNCWDEIVHLLWILHARDNLSLSVRKLGEAVLYKGSVWTKESYQQYALKTLQWAQELSGFTRYQANVWHSDLLSLVLTAAFNAGGCSEAASCVAAAAGDISLLPSLFQDKAQRLMNYWKVLCVNQKEAATTSSHSKHCSSPSKSMTKESSFSGVTMFELYKRACKDHYTDSAEEPRLNNIILWEEHTSMVLLLASVTFVKDNEALDQASLFRPLLVQYGRVLREKEFHNLVIAHEVMKQFCCSRGKSDAEQTHAYSTYDSLGMLTLSNMISLVSEDRNESKGLFRSLSKGRLHHGTTGSVTLRIHRRCKTALRTPSPRPVSKHRKGARLSQSLSRGRSPSPRSRKERQRLSRASFHMDSSARSSSSKRPEKVTVSPHLLVEEVIDVLEREYDVQSLIPQETLGLILWIMNSERKFVNLDMRNGVRWDPDGLSHLGDSENRNSFDNSECALKLNIDDISVLRAFIFSNIQFDYIGSLKSETGRLITDRKALKHKRRKTSERKKILSKENLKFSGKETEVRVMEITDGAGKQFNSKTENGGLYIDKSPSSVEKHIDDFKGDHIVSQQDDAGDGIAVAVLNEQGKERLVEEEEVQEFPSEETLAKELEECQFVDTTLVKEQTHEEHMPQLPMEDTNVEEQKVEQGKEDAVQENLVLRSRRGTSEEGRDERQHGIHTGGGEDIQSAVRNELQTILHVQQAGILAMMDAMRVMQRNNEHGISHAYDEMAFAQSDGQMHKRGIRRIGSHDGETANIQTSLKKGDTEVGTRMDASLQVSPSANTWKPFRLSQESSKKTSCRVIKVQEAGKAKDNEDNEVHWGKKKLTCNRALQPETFSNNSDHEDLALGGNVPEISSVAPVDDTLDDITLLDSLHASDLEEEVGNRDSLHTRYMQTDQGCGGTCDIRLEHQTAGRKSERKTKILEPQNEIFRPQPSDYRRPLLWDQEDLKLRKIPIKVQPRNAQKAGEAKKERVNIFARYDFTENEKEDVMSRPFKLLTLPKDHGKEDEKRIKPMVLRKLPMKENKATKPGKHSEIKWVMLQEKDNDLRSQIGSVQNGYDSTFVNFKPIQVPKVLPSKAESGMSFRFLEPSEVMAFYQANLQRQKTEAFRTLKMEPLPQKKVSAPQRKEPAPQRKEKNDEHDDSRNGQIDKSPSKLDKHFIEQVKNHTKQYKKVTEQYHLLDSGGEMNFGADESQSTHNPTRAVTNAALQYVATQKINIYAPEQHSQEEKETQTAVGSTAVKFGAPTNRLVRQKYVFDGFEVNEAGEKADSHERVLDVAVPRAETETLEEEPIMSSDLVLTRQRNSYGKVSGLEEPCKTRNGLEESAKTSDRVDTEPGYSRAPDNDVLPSPLYKETHRNSLETDNGRVGSEQTTKHESHSKKEVIIPDKVLVPPTTSTQPAVFVPHGILGSATSTDAALLNLVDIPDDIVKEKLDACGEALNKTIEIDNDDSWSGYRRSSQENENGMQKLDERIENIHPSSLMEDSEGAFGKVESEEKCAEDIVSKFHEAKQKTESTEPREKERKLPIPQEKWKTSQPFVAQQVGWTLGDGQRDQRVKVALSSQHREGHIYSSDEVLLLDNDRACSYDTLSFNKVPEILSFVVTKETSLDDLMNAFTQGKITFEELYKLGNEVKLKYDNEIESSAVDVKGCCETDIIQEIEAATDEVFQGLQESKCLVENIDILMKISENRMEKAMRQITNRSRPGNTVIDVNEQHAKTFQLEKALDSVSEGEFIDFIENIDSEIPLTDNFIEKIMSRVQNYRSNASDGRTISVPDGNLFQVSVGSSFQPLDANNTGREGNTPKSAETARSHHLEDLRINLSGVRSVSPLDTYKADMSLQNGKMKKQKHRAEIRKWMKEQRLKRREQEKKQQQLNCISKVQLDTYRSIKQDRSRHHKLDSTFTISAENQGLTGRQLRERSREREKVKLKQKRSFQSKREEIVLSMMEDLTDGVTTHRDILEKDPRKCLSPIRQTSKNQKTARGSGTKQSAATFDGSVGNSRNSSFFEKAQICVGEASGSKDRDSASNSSCLTIGSTTFMTSPSVSKNVMLPSEEGRTFKASERVINKPVVHEMEKLVHVLGSDRYIKEENTTKEIKELVQVVRADRHIKDKSTKEKTGNLAYMIRSGKYIKEKRPNSETSSKHAKRYDLAAEKTISELESVLSQPGYCARVGEGKKTGEQITHTHHKEFVSSSSFQLDRISEVDSDVCSADWYLENASDKVEQIPGTNASSDSSWTVPDDIKKILYE